MDAYIDIETTGLKPYSDHIITVCGIYLFDGHTQKEEVRQFVGDQVTATNVLGSVAGCKALYSYNGREFDFPFIKEKIGLDLETLRPHVDLMIHCWKHHLYGGLKKVEQILGITRSSGVTNGQEAILLWKDWEENHNQLALDMLLEYNKEDIKNLRILRNKLVEMQIKNKV